MLRFLIGLMLCLIVVPSSVAAQGRDGFVAPPVQINRSVPAGQQTRLWFAWGIAPDCQTLRGWSVTVVQSPRNGTASLARAPETITETLIRRGHTQAQQLQFARRCIGSEILTISLNYTPKAGFTGTDSLVVESKSTRGVPQRRTTFNINVR